MSVFELFGKIQNIIINTVNMYKNSLSTANLAKIEFGLSKDNII